MFWILRRTRLTSAAAFFNAINNNNQSSNNATGQYGILYFCGTAILNLPHLPAVILRTRKILVPT
jgi:hypothetical protein